MRAEALAQVLRPLDDIFHASDYPNLRVGLSAPDDAAVWQVDDERALVLTTDFFTPVVDDPYDYGAIAAANSLSDVYAMGAQPFLALNIAALPPDLPTEMSTAILRGGAEKAREAGVVIAGGHTVQDKEPKYGLVVVGFVHPQKILTKGGAQPGDWLVLTKPLGSGVLATAHKRELITPEELLEMTGWMKRLNQRASLMARELNVRAATDITGFGLLGHAHEMAQASGVRFELRFHDLPMMTGATARAQMWTFPGGASDNQQYFSQHVTFSEDIPEWGQMLLFDPQTSGGLLLAVPPAQTAQLPSLMQKYNQLAWVVGRVTDGSGIHVA